MQHTRVKLTFVGFLVGDLEGLLLLLGSLVGAPVGLFVGKAGLPVGDFVGLSVTGLDVGCFVGFGVWWRRRGDFRYCLMIDMYCKPG